MHPANKSCVLCGTVQEFELCWQLHLKDVQLCADGCGQPMRHSDRLRQIAEQTADLNDTVFGNRVAERVKKRRRVASHKYCT